MEEWWERYAYFCGRDSLLINSNFFGTLFEARPHANPLLRAAALIRGGGKFHAELMLNEIGPDSLDADGRAPMCMYQYSRLFGSARIPGIQCDHIDVHHGSKHVIIIAKDQVYSMQLFLDVSIVCMSLYVIHTLTSVTIVRTAPFSPYLR